jgi:hypothetical protein
VLIAMLAAVAWLTRHPDAPIVRAARDWPLIGPVAEIFHRAYVPSQQDSQKSRDLLNSIESADSEVVRRIEVEIVESEPLVVGAMPYAWVWPETPIYSAPDTDSPVLFTTSALANLPILRQEEKWFRIVQPLPGEPSIHGWVLLDEERDSEPPSTPDPVLPLAAVSIRPDRLDSAIELMSGRAREYDCGPYRLFTDALDSSWIALCPGIVEELEQVYRSRYELQPVSAAAETILLFGSERDYRSFRDREEIPFESQVAHSYPPRGYVALVRADRQPQQVVSSLVHELTHLLNRRALGPALPHWLSEGMADDLAESSIGSLGSLSPGVLGGQAKRFERLTLRSGGVASLVRLRTLDQLGTLPTLEDLIRLEAEQFYEPSNSQLHYALSSFWIRFLLSNPDDGLAQGFRSFLRSVSVGMQITETSLSNQLRSDLPDLEDGFRDWLRNQNVD